MRAFRLPAMGALLILAACGSSKDIAPPKNAVGIEDPSDAAGRNARIAGRWITDTASMPKGAIRMEVAKDGTYRMRLLEDRNGLVDTILSASAGSLKWNKAGFVRGVDEHPAPDMKRFGRWTAGFEDDARKILLAPVEGKPVVFERDLSPE